MALISRTYKVNAFFQEPFTQRSFRFANGSARPLCRKRYPDVKEQAEAQQGQGVTSGHLNNLWQRWKQNLEEILSLEICPANHDPSTNVQELKRPETATEGVQGLTNDKMMRKQNSAGETFTSSLWHLTYSFLRTAKDAPGP